MRKVIRLFNVTENETSPGVWSIIYRDDSEVKELARIIAGASGLEVKLSTKVEQIGAWEFDVEDLQLPPENPEAYEDAKLPSIVVDAEKDLHLENKYASQEIIDQDSLPIKREGDDQGGTPS